MQITELAAEARKIAKQALRDGTLTLPEGVRWSVRQNKTYDGLEFVLRGLDRASFYKPQEQLAREGTSRRMLTEQGNDLVTAISALFADTGRPAGDYDPHADYQDKGYGRVTVYAYMAGEEYGRDVQPNWP